MNQLLTDECNVAFLYLKLKRVTYWLSVTRYSLKHANNATDILCEVTHFMYICMYKNGKFDTFWNKDVWEFTYLLYVYYCTQTVRMLTSGKFVYVLDCSC